MTRPRMFFSGIDRQEHLKLLEQEGAAGMVSALSIISRDSPFLQAILEQPQVPLALDCGYTNRPSFKDYAQLLERLETLCLERFQFYISYDEPGDQTQSDIFHAQLAEWFPDLRTRLLWVFQTHWGSTKERQEQFERLEEACQQEFTIAVGGMVPLLRQHTAHALTLLQEIGQVFGKYYPTQAHVLGVSSPEVLLWLRTQPWIASVDSRRWLVAACAREVIQLTGKQRKANALALPLTQEDCAALNIRVFQQLLDADKVFWKDFWPFDDAITEDQTREIWLSIIRHRSRQVVVQDLEEKCLPSHDWYVPLFQRSACEYGLLSWQPVSSAIDSQSQWCVIWDADPDTQDRFSRQGFLVDGKCKMTLYAHDDVQPCRCSYSFPVAISVAKALVPFENVVL